jgi:hypothetical protein
VVVFDQDVRGAIEGAPGFQSLSRLTAELRKPAGQGEAGSDAQVTVYGASSHLDLVPELVPVGGGN